MANVRTLANACELARDHDGLLVDLWGVVHDGERLFDGVADALVAIAAAGVRICFLSNSSRLGPLLTDNLVALGVPRNAFVGAVSSGDVTRAALVARSPALFGALPSEPRVLHLGSAGFVPWLFELGLAFTESDDAADLVVATGTVKDESELTALAARLAPLAARDVPLVCTNPDRVVPMKGKLHRGPGAVAHLYAELGGRTFLYGKPHAPIYEAALQLLDRTRVVAIGDMMETDVVGARRANLASVLVTSGVHREELGDPADPAKLDALFARHGVLPDAVLRFFR